MILGDSVEEPPSLGQFGTLDLDLINNAQMDPSGDVPPCNDPMRSVEPNSPPSLKNSLVAQNKKAYVPTVDARAQYNTNPISSWQGPERFPTAAELALQMEKEQEAAVSFDP